RSWLRRTSDVKPGRDHDVFHDESEAQEHLHGKSHHRYEEESSEPKAHRSPTFHELPSLDPDHPPVEQTDARGEICSNAKQSENRRPCIIAKSNTTRQYD